jgi:phenylalanyl-tRNA synthetase beta chain
MNLLVSYKWLKEYVHLKQTPQEFAARLSLSGPSVERIYPQGGSLEKVVIGRVLKVKPHPNADKLRIVEADLGTMTKEIVCGGSNLAEGQLVAVALPGAKVKWHGEGEPVEIKEMKLRGADSYGMICAANEIGLFELYPHAEREILDLTSTRAPIGAPLADALKLDDVVFDVEVTSNRPDAYCLTGMARESAAILKTPLAWKGPKMPKAKAGAKLLPLAVELKAKKLCPRYQALVMRHAKVGPSPAWMKERLASAGVRSINNLVDITNYVRLELGQPMHVFDYDKLSGKKIVVREAAAGEKLKALDGNTYELKARRAARNPARPRRRRPSSSNPPPSIRSPSAAPPALSTCTPIPPSCTKKASRPRRPSSPSSAPPNWRLNSAAPKSPRRSSTRAPRNTRRSSSRSAHRAPPS